MQPAALAIEAAHTQLLIVEGQRAQERGIDVTAQGDPVLALQEAQHAPAVARVVRPDPDDAVENAGTGPGPAGEIVGQAADIGDFLRLAQGQAAFADRCAVALLAAPRPSHQQQEASRQRRKGGSQAGNDPDLPVPLGQCHRIRLAHPDVKAIFAAALVRKTVGRVGQEGAAGGIRAALRIALERRQQFGRERLVARFQGERGRRAHASRDAFEAGMAQHDAAAGAEFDPGHDAADLVDIEPAVDHAGECAVGQCDAARELPHPLLADAVDTGRADVQFGLGDIAQVAQLHERVHIGDAGVRRLQAGAIDDRAGGVGGAQRGGDRQARLLLAEKVVDVLLAGLSGRGLAGNLVAGRQHGDVHRIENALEGEHQRARQVLRRHGGPRFGLAAQVGQRQDRGQHRHRDGAEGRHAQLVAVKPIAPSGQAAPDGTPRRAQCGGGQAVHAARRSSAAMSLLESSWAISTRMIMRSSSAPMPIT